MMDELITAFKEKKRAHDHAHREEIRTRTEMEIARSQMQNALIIDAQHLLGTEIIYGGKKVKITGFRLHAYSAGIINPMIAHQLQSTRDYGKKSYPALDLAWDWGIKRLRRCIRTGDGSMRFEEELS